jgi:hypothetical protein
LNPEISRELEAICLRCLEKEPAKRYASAAELAGGLERFLRGEPGQARVGVFHGRVWRWPLVAAACAVAALAVFLIMIVTGWRHPIEFRGMPKTAKTAPVVPTQASPIPAVQSPPPHAAAKPVSKKKADVKKAPPAAPVSLSILPDRGTGSSQTFALHFTDSEGAGDIGTVKIAFHDPAGNRDCAVFLEPDDGRVELQFNPAGGSGLRVPGNVGTLDRIENPVCAVDLIGASLTRQGNDLEVKLPMIFKQTFEGLKEIKSWVWDKKGTVRVAGQMSGQWIVGGDHR